ncbi:hypothetical protein [uncultured Flavobacterium sp.]|uniref:hypothetical protein n=1 Tax=uncultured Flavobacterium sp. TaxID=165435 RepID=UPI0025CF695D|nr:hypothetical protein [uncultured Flavobacterium sp.]
MKHEEKASNFSNEELLKGFSIEELQERKEFSAPDTCWCDPTPPCCFGYPM